MTIKRSEIILTPFFYDSVAIIVGGELLIITGLLTVS